MAAKAYDKAALYLYGDKAITNFGLQACQQDTTEVLACETCTCSNVHVQHRDELVTASVNLRPYFS